MEPLIHKINKSQVSDLDEKGIVTVAANAFGNEDADGDISMKGSFTKTIDENFSRLKWFLNHDTTLLLGVPQEAQQIDKYLQVRGQLNMKKQIGRDTYEDYKLYAENNKTLEHSIGVIAIKRDNMDRRKVLEWKWMEYSTLTSWGANPDTPMLGIKSAKDPIEAIAWLELCLNKGNYSDMKGKALEKQIEQLKALINSSEPSGDTHQSNEPPFDIKTAIKQTKFFN